ncbi:MAG TPA: hypothetical protein VEC96_02335, partial [Anaerolineae bacterium]|nr:hypothetical protein [Anaerolineae bacterium]
REYLSVFGEWSFILLGAVAIVMMLFAPQGIWGFLHGRFGLELFPVRRRLPAHLRDAGPAPIEQPNPVKEAV